MSTITPDQQQSITDLLTTCHLPRGLGKGKHEACSIAAINLALTGRRTDDIPECMSPVIGRWIIRIQDVMPDQMRNSSAWKSLLPLAAGTGRCKENERLAIIRNWMWGDVLPLLQETADKGGYGEVWRKMCKERSSHAANAAANAAYAAAYATNAANAADSYWQIVNPTTILRRLIEP